MGSGTRPGRGHPKAKAVDSGPRRIWCSQLPGAGALSSKYGREFPDCSVPFSYWEQRCALVGAGQGWVRAGAGRGAGSWVRYTNWESQRCPCREARVNYYQVGTIQSSKCGRRPVPPKVFQRGITRGSRRWIKHARTRPEGPGVGQLPLLGGCRGITAPFAY